ncbi:MAG TPA: hypothetical protein VFS62_10775, partial [Chloroflexota bacterium]|nr:hypothetical protein [Chloroflexota bacterium]
MRDYGRIRPVRDLPPDAAAAEPDFRLYSLLAGTAIVAGLAVFGALVFAVFYLFHTLLPSLTVTRDASITAVVGTVEMREAGTTRWSVVTGSDTVREGDEVRTDNGRALITFFDQSTLTLYSNTDLRFTTMRTNRFGSGLHSPARTIIDVRELAGRALFGVAHLNPVAKVSFTVGNGPNETASLDEGSFIAKVTPAGVFDILATRGSSVVSTPKGHVTISGGERTEIHSPTQPPDAPILAAEDLITNGSFTQADASGRPASWDFLTPAPEAADVPGSIRLTSDDSFSVVRFTRTKSTYHAEESIRQVVNQDVTDYSTIRLDLRFRVFSQSVSGGGDQGSEYPLMVRVNYLDQNGQPALFVHGFYVQNANNLPTTN